VSALAACAYYLDELEKLRAEDADIVAINLASTESINRAARDVTTVDEFYALVDGDSPVISGGIAFALACIEARVPYCDFTPDLTLECPALLQLARDQRMPVAGKDGNTGQTFLKLVLAEAIVKRNLGIIGWYSANVLGNLDGRVLTLPGHRETKLEDKLTALDSIVPYEFHHVVDIAFEPSRGDHKEAWDTVNLKGWLGRRVSLRVNWCASDSILAAPLTLDICRLLHLSSARGESGVQTQLSPFFKHPIGHTRTSLVQEYLDLERHYGI
jgi:myo-inositol-1-phosphate synthase